MFERYKVLIFGIVVLAIVGGVIVLLTYQPAPTVITNMPPPPSATLGPLNIYVTGAVVHPQQIYALPVGSRVQDALEAAGGASPDADLAHVNLARVLQDGEQIDVPQLGAQAGTKGTASASGPVHINTATLDDLQRLPGVGPAIAQRILDYRNQHGPFRSLADLDKVSGIGPTRLKEWAGLVVFD